MSILRRAVALLGVAGLLVACAEGSSASDDDILGGDDDAGGAGDTSHGSSSTSGSSSGSSGSSSGASGSGSGTDREADWAAAPGATRATTRAAAARTAAAALRAPPSTPAPTAANLGTIAGDKSSVTLTASGTMADWFVIDMEERTTAASSARR